MAHGGDIYRNKVNMDFSVNLSPLPLPDPSAEKINSAMLKGLRDASNYPDPEQTAVRRALSDLVNTDFDCIYAGSGASELIMACVRAVNPSKVLLILPCYSGYLHSLGIHDDLSNISADSPSPYVHASITDSLRHSDRIAGKASGSGSGNDKAQIIKYYLKKENGFRLTGDILNCLTENIDLMFLTDPWNPNGLNIPDELLKSILDKADECGISVLLDQSFLPLSDKAANPGSLNASHLINRYKQLFIIRSYTKLFALPGIRMGYIISAPDNISIVRNHLPEWNLSSVATQTIIACADIAGNTSYIIDNMDLIQKERRYLTGELKRLGFKAFDSNTAFILLESGYDLYKGLLSQGILIRDCSDYEGLGKGFYRIAVRGHASNAVLIGTICGLLRAGV